MNELAKQFILKKDNFLVRFVPRVDCVLIYYYDSEWGRRADVDEFIPDESVSIERGREIWQELSDDGYKTLDPDDISFLQKIIIGMSE